MPAEKLSRRAALMLSELILESRCWAWLCSKSCKSARNPAPIRFTSPDLASEHLGGLASGNVSAVV
jgi:hypothetical protein